MGASVVSRGNPPPILELGEHVLDFVALAVERFVIVEGAFSVFSTGDAWRNASPGQLLAEPGAVVASIGDQRASLW